MGGVTFVDEPNLGFIFQLKFVVEFRLCSCSLVGREGSREQGEVREDSGLGEVRGEKVKLEEEERDFKAIEEVEERCQESNDNSYSIEMFKSDITINSHWREVIIHAAKAHLASVFWRAGITGFDFNQDFDIETFFEEAFVMFQEIEGEPVLVILNGRTISMGFHPFSKIEEVALSKNSWDKLQINEGISLCPNIKILYDFLQASSGPGRLGGKGIQQLDSRGIEQGQSSSVKIESELQLNEKKEVGLSTQLKGQNWLVGLRANLAQMGKGSSSKDEVATVVVNKRFGKNIKTWSKSIIFRNSLVGQKRDRVQWGLAGGASIDLFENFGVMVDMNYINNIHHKSNVSFYTPPSFGPGFLRKNNELKVQYGYTRYYNDGTQSNLAPESLWKINYKFIFENKNLFFDWFK